MLITGRKKKISCKCSVKYNIQYQMQSFCLSCFLTSAVDQYILEYTHISGSAIHSAFPFWLFLSLSTLSSLIYNVLLCFGVFFWGPVTSLLSIGFLPHWTIENQELTVYSAYGTYIAGSSAIWRRCNSKCDSLI